MLKDKLSQYIDEKNICPKGREFILAAAEGPSRRVTTAAGNYTVRFSSEKMSLSVQSESLDMEYIWLRQLEFDEHVMFMFDQPPKLKISYTTDRKKAAAFYSTFDYLVLTDSGVYIDECKNYSNLLSLAEKKSRDLYYLSSSKEVKSPAFERAVEELGFTFRFVTEKNLNYSLHRNIKYIHDFLRLDCEDHYYDQLAEIQRLLRGRVFVTLKELTETFDTTLVLTAIAKNHLYVNLLEDILALPISCKVFYSPSWAKVYLALVKFSKASDVPHKKIQLGMNVHFKGEDCRVNIIKDDSLELESQSGQRFSVRTDEFLDIGKGLVSDGFDDIRQSIKIPEELLHASEEELELALNQYTQMQLPEAGSQLGYTKRHINRLMKRCRDAALKYGEELGFLGLLNKNYKKGNSQEKLPGDTKTRMLDHIASNYLVNNGPTRYNAYKKFKELCEDEGTDAVSYKTYAAYCNETPVQVNSRVREGRKRANQSPTDPCVQEITVPRHGDRAWERAHVDHTELDILLKSDLFENQIVKLWLTMLSDSFSRYPLAFFLSVRPPSRKSVQGVIYNCITRHHRLPDEIIFDGGPEFSSTYFEKLLASLHSSAIQRGAEDAKHGTLGERPFGAINTQLLDGLAGCTKNTKVRRNVSTTHDPKKEELLTVTNFYARFQEFIEEKYPKLENMGTLENREESFKKSCESQGNRSTRVIDHNRVYPLLMLFPVSRKGIRTVSSGTVKVNNLLYRVPPSYGVKNSDDVEVREYIDDYTKVMAFIGTTWVVCPCVDSRIVYQKSLEPSLIAGQIIDRYRHVYSNYIAVPKYMRALEKKIEKATCLKREAESLQSKQFSTDQSDLSQHDDVSPSSPKNNNEETTAESNPTTRVRVVNLKES